VRGREQIRLRGEVVIERVRRHARRRRDRLVARAPIAARREALARRAQDARARLRALGRRRPPRAPRLRSRSQLRHGARPYQMRGAGRSRTPWRIGRSRATIRLMSQQARRLLQLGVLLFLLSLLAGFVIPALAVPRLGVSAHVNGVLGALFLAALARLSPRLRLGPRAAGLAFWLALYSFFMGALIPLLAGLWGAGGALLPIAGGAARGSPFQEGLIATGLVTAGVTVVALCVLVLVGLRAS